MLTQAAGNAGNIRLLSHTTDISGFTPDGLFSGFLSYSQTANSGSGGNIIINQPGRSQGTVRLANRGFIAVATNSSSDGGTADERYDYYSFTITAPNSLAIFDIDGGNGYTGNPGAMDTEITLFHRATGEIVAINDDANIERGAGGSSAIQDSYISTKLNPGTYVIGVGEFDTVPNSVQLLEGDRVDRGDIYTLHVSVENGGTGTSLPTTNINPNNFNPNYGGGKWLSFLESRLWKSGEINY